MFAGMLRKQGRRSLLPAVSPLSGISRLLGLAPGPWEGLETSKALNSAYTFAVIILINGLLVVRIRLMPRSVTQFPVTLDLVTTAAASNAALIVFATSARYSVKTIIGNLCHPDVMPYQYINATFVYFVVYTTLLVPIVLQIFDGVAWSIITQNFSAFFDPAILHHTIVACIHSQHYVFVNMVEKSFKKLNADLSTLLDGGCVMDVTRNKCVSVLCACNCPHFIETNHYIIKQLHYQVRMIVTLINHAYGFPLLFSFLSSFCSLTTAVFSVVSLVFNHPTAELPAMWTGSSRVLWATYSFFKFLVTTLSCHAATSEAQRTTSLVRKICLHAPDPSVVDQLCLISQDIQHHRVVFLILRIFSINRETLINMAGSVVTFAIILLQNYK